MFFRWIRHESRTKLRSGTNQVVGIFGTGGAPAMKMEPNYGAESITWREYLQRATKYAEMEVYTDCVKYKYKRETPYKHGV